MSASAQFIPVNIAILTVSDTRTLETDTSGAVLLEQAESAGHVVVDRALLQDDIYQIRSVVSQWIASEEVEAIIITGGTGFSQRDITPEAILPLLDKEVEGFGELFRSISYQEIGTSTVQSRAIGGLANETVIFCVPGSTNACRTAWNKLLAEQLDARHKPCNFVKQITARRLSLAGCESRG